MIIPLTILLVFSFYYMFKAWTQPRLTDREVMVKKGLKIHLVSSVIVHPSSACGIPYPTIQTTCFFKVINCKRCKATYEYRANIEAEKDIAYEEEGK